MFALAYGVKETYRYIFPHDNQNGSMLWSRTFIHKDLEAIWVRLYDFGVQKVKGQGHSARKLGGRALATSRVRIAT